LFPSVAVDQVDDTNCIQMPPLKYNGKFGQGYSQVNVCTGNNVKYTIPLARELALKWWMDVLTRIKDLNAKATRLHNSFPNDMTAQMIVRHKYGAPSLLHRLPGSFHTNNLSITPAPLATGA
jgi:hypothetical protein